MINLALFPDQPKKGHTHTLSPPSPISHKYDNHIDIFAKKTKIIPK